MGSPPRIAMVLPDLRGGGAERVALRLAQEFARRGHPVDFVLKNATGALLEEAAQSARIIDLGAAKLRNVVMPLTRYLRTVMAVVAHRLARSRARLVLSDHNTLSRAYAAKGRLHMRLLGATVAWFYPRADALVAVSRGVADDLAALSGVARDRWSVIYNPIGAPAVASGDEAPAPQWRNGAKRILAVGSLTRQKNFTLLVEAFARLAQQRDAQLTILGTGPLRDDIAAAAARLGVADRLSLPGFVERPWVYFRTADLYVMSSDHEGLPMVLIEALHYGLTIVRHARAVRRRGRARRGDGRRARPSMRSRDDQRKRARFLRHRRRRRLSRTAARAGRMTTVPVQGGPLPSA